MAARLPIVPDQVDCDLYAARLPFLICVERWRKANGKDGDIPTYLKISHCRACPQGAGRDWYTRIKEQAMGKKLTERKPCPKCHQPKLRLEQTPEGPMCRSCKQNRFSVKGRQERLEKVYPPVPPEEEQTSLVQYLGKHGLIEAMKERHKQELAAALAEVGAFEAEHPEVVDQARLVFDRIFKNQLALPPAATDEDGAGESQDRTKSAVV